MEYFEEKPVLQLCTLAQGPSSLAPAQFSSQFDPHSSPLPPLSSQTATALAQSQDKLPKNVNSGYGQGTDGDIPKFNKFAGFALHVSACFAFFCCFVLLLGITFSASRALLTSNSTKSI